MKKICVIATGGTIVSSDSGHGLRPELQGNELIDRIISYREEAPKRLEAFLSEGKLSIEVKDLMNIDSSDMQPENWLMIGDLIDKERDSFDGFVVTHGTDTMAFTAAALTVMLKGIGKPVIMTGSQLPIGFEGTDAVRNFCDAVFAAMGDAAGVYLAFNGRLLEGRYVTKIDSEDFDAFAEVKRRYPDTEKNGERTGEKTGGQNEEGYEYRPHFNRKVRFISLYPGLSAEDLLSMVAEDTEAVVLELYGAGGISTGQRNLIPAVQKIIESGKKVYAVSQCLYGATDLSRYEVGRKHLSLGVSSLGVCTREYAIVTAMHEA